LRDRLTAGQLTLTQFI